MKILNLSDHILSESEYNLLKRGLKFCPTPTSNNADQNTIDLFNFCRRLRLREFFYDKNINNPSIVKPPSLWEPDPKLQSDELNKAIDYIKQYPIPKRKGSFVDNISQEERNAINHIKNNKNIIIKEADKGAAIVIMNSSFYEQKINEILNDSETYLHVSNNSDKTVINKIKALVKKYENILTTDESKYLTNFEYKTSMIYGLPKIHKSTIIQNAIKTQQEDFVTIKDPIDLKMRPIVAGTQCPTHRLSNFVNILIQPFLKYVKSYTRDTVHFLNKLPPHIEEDETFATLDVVGLYSNITHDLGLTALKYYLNKYPNEITRISANFILEAAELILKNNYFEFNSKNFLQINGTAMGTIFAPTYANLSLGYLEILLENKLTNLVGQEACSKILNNYSRYLDDIFLIWNAKIAGSIQNFRDNLCSLDSRISFTLDQHNKSVSFLDVRVSAVDSKIMTDIFYKETDSKRYLDYHSCHPRHIKNNVPFNLARRICTIVSDNDILQKRLEELKTFLIACNYPLLIIDNGINKAKMIPKSNLRDCKIASKNPNAIPFISTYDPNYQNQFNTASIIINNLKCNLQQFENVSLVNSRRQPNNLKKFLTMAKFTNDPSMQYNVSKCEDKKCKLCDHIYVGNSFKFSNGDIFKVNANMNCNVLNVIYVIECISCNAQYIGETNNFRLRMNLHRDHTRKNAVLAVNKHLYECNMNSEIKFRVMPFFKVRQDDTLLRKMKENYFIKKFTPILNRSE